MRMKFFAIIAVLTTAVLFFAAVVNAQTLSVADQTKQLQDQIVQLQAQLQAVSSNSHSAATFCNYTGNSSDYYTKGTLTTDAPVWTSPLSDSCSKKIPNLQDAYTDVASCSGANCYIHKYSCDGTSPKGNLGVKCIGGCNDGACLKWCHDFSKYLYIGSTGSEVKELQKALTSEGLYTASIDGTYDSGVYNAAKKFQKKYDISATGYVGPLTRAKLNALYGCKTSQPSITVTSPNGGETWKVGETHTITWNSSNLPQSDKITITAFSSYNTVLNQDGSINRPGGFNVQIANNIDNSGSYSWTIPGNLPSVSNFFIGNNYYLQITATGPSYGQIMDYSNNQFTIAAVSAQPTIAITTPNSDATWVIGQKYTVSWNETGLDNENVVIGLTSGTNGYQVINPPGVPATDGTYSFNLPFTIPAGSGYKVYINVVSGKITTTYGTASITVSSVPTPQPTITVASPNGGETLTIGQPFTVTWNNPTTITSLEIDLFKGGSLFAPIGYVSASAGSTMPSSYSWTLPSAIGSKTITAGSDYQIRVLSMTDNTVYDLSDNNFSIAAAPVCTPNWQCTAWNTCANSQQARTCTDLNNCGVATGKPAVSQACTVATCTDSDASTAHPDGKDYFTKGVVVDSSPQTIAQFGKAMTFTDLCYAASGKIFEYYCDPNLGYSQGVWYTCPNGCSNGACNQPTTLAPSKNPVTNQSLLNSMAAALANIASLLKQLSGQ